MTEDAIVKLTAGGLAAIAVALFVYVLLKRFWRENPDEAPASAEPRLTVLSDAGGPRCICGDIATDPAPKIARGRGTVIRDPLGMPPRYRRVWGDGPPVYCRSHAHSADAAVAEFLARERAELQRYYRQMAHNCAAFETEGLARAVAESLSDAQRKAGRRPVNGTAGPAVSPPAPGASN